MQTKEEQATFNMLWRMGVSLEAQSLHPDGTGIWHRVTDYIHNPTADQSWAKNQALQFQAYNFRRAQQ